MMRSLYSGVSGLRVHQTKMDVIGNNIANVNTIGFKASSVNFSDVFYQTIQSATGPNATTGAAGQNAKQIGLGSSVASITASITTTGGSQRTDNPFDIMISGDSFFVVNNAGTNYFTKAGSFGIDAAGYLCTASGATVMGWGVDPNDENKTVAESVQALKVRTPENLYSEPEATTKTNITGNIDKNDTQIASDATGKMINMEFYDNLGYKYTADLKVLQTAGATNQYTVDVTGIRDEDGDSIFVSKTLNNGKYQPSSITSVTLGDIKYDAKVDPDTGKVTLATTGTATSPTITFDGTSGKFIAVDKAGTTTAGATTSTDKSLAFSINQGTTGTAAPNPFEKIDVDFSSITMFAKSGSSALEASKGGLDNLGAGKKAGNMTGVSIDGAGKIYGKYDNGDSKLLGQIAVASFANPSGLEAVGDSMFAQTQNSGDFDGIGHDITQDGGKFTTGVLEMSNVDLSAQFTDMITTQRGFQANSRIITTSDTLLEELINLKR